MQAAITPAMALELLKDGNKRFGNNLKVNRNLLQQANETSDGQHPFATRRERTLLSFLLLDVAGRLLWNLITRR